MNQPNPLDPSIFNLTLELFRLITPVIKKAIADTEDIQISINNKNNYEISHKLPHQNIMIRGGVLPVMAYMGRLCLKGVPFSGFRYIKG